MKKLWMVRAGERGRLINEFIDDGAIKIGWADVGDLSQVKSLKEIKKLTTETYSGWSKGKYAISASQISRFRFDINKEETVVTYNPSERVYHIGEVTSDYIFDKTGSEYNHIKKVNWFKKVNRDSLSSTTKNSLGAISTIFQIPVEASKDLLKDSTTIPKEKDEDEDNLDTIKEDILEKSLEFIKDKIVKLDWEELQELVAGVLRAMGYKTLVSPRGADRGKDIVASPDGLGLEDPKIKVEVKHHPNTTMGSQEIRSLLGGLRSNEKSLFVSTGGFSKDAKYEAERANNPLTLIDLDLLVDLLIQHYDNSDSETKALVPLKKFYWPI